MGVLYKHRTEAHSCVSTDKVEMYAQRKWKAGRQCWSPLQAVVLVCML